MKKHILFLLASSFAFSVFAQQKPLYSYDKNQQTRWSSGENLNGRKSSGGKENFGAKGHPQDDIQPGASRTLLDVQGMGIVNRMWFTINDRSLEMLRSLKLEMYWDNEKKPAVSVPVADFYGMGQGITRFENEFFASPEGRSFICIIPMPFKKAAKIVITNESAKRLTNIFFDVDYSLLTQWNNDFLYLHAFWNRDTATTLAKDFELLPHVHGRGRFVGTHVTVNANPVYKKSWWGEGEVKMFIDDDGKFPTLVGTGTEDYIGTAWGQGSFINRFAGCLAANDSADKWSFYRYHVPDPVFFSTGIKVTWQQLGGNMKSVVQQMQDDKAPLIPVTIDDMEKSGKLIFVYEPGKITNVRTANLPEAWTNFYRSDDVAATSFFYLDRPSNDLPTLKPAEYRTARLK